MYYYNAREMANDTKAICDEYDLTARTTKGRTIGYGHEVYAIDGIWDFDGEDVKVQFQYVLEYGRWRCLAFGLIDNRWEIIPMPYQENGFEAWHGYFNDLADCIENALDEIPDRLEMVIDNFDLDDDYADEADDVDE